LLILLRSPPSVIVSIIETVVSITVSIIESVSSGPAVIIMACVTAPPARPSHVTTEHGVITETSVSPVTTEAVPVETVVKPST